MRALVLVGVVACGPSIAAKDPQLAGRDVLARATDDAFAALVRGGVTNGGLWFDDEACRRDFGARGDVPKDKLAAFAHCLAGLHLQPSTREHERGDVVVMTSGPFELEARFASERSGLRLVWIGFEAQVSEQDRLPTLSPAAIEALRLDGTRDGPLDPKAVAALEADFNANLHAASTWIKFCVDEYGAVTDAVPFETTTVRARDAAVLAVLAWRFEPFVLAGQPAPACSLARLAYPAGATLGETVPLPPPMSPDRKPRLVFATAHLGPNVAGAVGSPPSRDVRDAARFDGKASLVGRFRICVDDGGRVESVLLLRSTGYASYDRSLMRAMRTRVYRPYEVDGKHVPVCAHESFEWVLR